MTGKSFCLVLQYSSLVLTVIEYLIKSITIFINHTIYLIVANKK